MILEWEHGRVALTIDLTDGHARLSGLSADGGASVVRPHALVDVFTAAEQHGRTSQAFVRSAIGERLRPVAHETFSDAVSVTQRDATTGVEVESVIRVLPGTAATQWTHTVRNGGPHALTLTAVSSLTIELADPTGLRLVTGESEWLAEGRWREQPLGDVIPDLALGAHGQDGRGRFARASHGAWSSGEQLPTALLVRDGGPSLAWQLETSAGWSWELAQTRESVVLVASGPGDLEHQFAERLEPGDTFSTVPVSLAIGAGGRDSAFAALTEQRRALRHRRRVDDGLPLVYNDYMNTLDGQPSTEALLPLIEAAAAAGAELFCIDAGWFTDETAYWPSIGDWREAPTRFTGGLSSVLDTIRARGMRAGLWLEPEIVGVDSPLADAFPEGAYFRRHGERVVEDRRHHLDLRHPAAREHLDETVDRLVAEYGVGYFKLDYNINPGVGTDVSAAGAGAGLLGHTRALRDWLLAAQQRHPEVLFENCASGAMRMDYALLSVAHQQSTSDQQDFRRYAPIAAAAPASIAPEQAANWAYPSVDMTDDETSYALVNGLAGRLMLTGFLPRLRPAQLALTHDAVALHIAWRDRLARAVPSWPLGLPGWDDEVIVLALHAPGADGGETLLCVWSRGDGGRVVLPGVTGTLARSFPAELGAWELTAGADAVTVEIPSGTSARAFVLTH